MNLTRSSATASPRRVEAIATEADCLTFERFVESNGVGVLQRELLPDLINVTDRSQSARMEEPDSC